MKVTVVVPCRNEAQHIERLLTCLLDQQTEHDLEIIFADGQSDDGTREILASRSTQDPRIRVIENAARIVSTGLNQAIRAASGDIILRMDAHTEYARDYIQRCLETLMATSAWNVGGPARTRSASVIGRAIEAAYHSPFSTGGARFHDVSYEGFVDTVTYGCWRKSTLEKIGMFDESLVRNQDDELNLRILRAGGSIWQSPRIVSWYYPRATIGSLFRQYFQYGYWKVAVIRKHHMPASWRHVVPALFVLDIVLLLVAGIVALVLGSGLSAWVAVSATASPLCVYACVLLIASALAFGSAGASSALLLPLVFFVYHLSYGLGFLAGVARICGRDLAGSRPRLDGTFAKLSR